MLRHVSTIDELVELIDREFSGNSAVCPICKSEIGTVNIPDVELGLPELKFMEFKFPGVFCTQGHCLISMENNIKAQEKNGAEPGVYRLYIEDLGVKVFEVMKIVKPYLNIDESMPNTQLYWVLMNKQNIVYTKGLSYEDAYDLLDKIQSLGARVRMIT